MTDPGLRPHRAIAGKCLAHPKSGRWEAFRSFSGKVENSSLVCPLDLADE